MPQTHTSRGPSRASRKKRRAKKQTGAETAPPADDGAVTSTSESADAKRYYRIGEVSRITDVKAHVLRYWESEFRWMAPAKSRSKQRMYRQRDIEIIQLLKRLLHEQRFTIAGARKKLKELGISRALDPASLRLNLQIDDRSRYGDIRDELQSIREMLV